MSDVGGQTNQTIGIIGGGKVGLNILDLFTDSSLARVIFVVDRNSTAPALVKARQNKISVYNDIDQTLAIHNVDFIFEVTGSAQVSDYLKSKIAGTTTQLITHEMAFLVLQTVEQRDQAVKTQVSAEISGIRTEIKQSLSGIQNLVGDIKNISDEMIMLALNARIEAARAGEYGRGFAVVAQKMAESVHVVQAITPEIEKVSDNISAISDKIEVSLKNLK